MEPKQEENYDEDLPNVSEESEAEEANEPELTPEQQFEQQVEDVVAKMVPNDKGVFEIPPELVKDLPHQVLVAARYAKRHRDTQGAYTRERQKAKALEETTSKLEQEILSTATMHISQEQRDELDELKLRDPDEWRVKLNEYEEEARNILAEKVSKIKQTGEEVSELEIRKAKLEAFVESTGIELNDEVIESNLPASYTKKLEKGEIDFDEFLTMAQEFLTKPKTIAGVKTPPKSNPNLSKAPGGHTPTPDAKEADILKSYEKEVY